VADEKHQDEQTSASKQEYFGTPSSTSAPMPAVSTAPPVSAPKDEPKAEAKAEPKPRARKPAKSVAERQADAIQEQIDLIIEEHQADDVNEPDLTPEAQQVVAELKAVRERLLRGGEPEKPLSVAQALEDAGVDLEPAAPEIGPLVTAQRAAMWAQAAEASGAPVAAVLEQPDEDETAAEFKGMKAADFVQRILDLRTERNLLRAFAAYAVGYRGGSMRLTANDLSRVTRAGSEASLSIAPEAGGGFIFTTDHRRV
jgi:hypothetical protein